jgi:hypothetical protein
MNNALTDINSIFNLQGTWLDREQCYFTENNSDWPIQKQQFKFGLFQNQVKANGVPWMHTQI